MSRNGTTAAPDGGEPRDAPKVRQIGYIGLAASDLAAWDDFAQQVIGLERVPDAGEWVRYRMDEQHHRLMLSASDRDEPLFAGWEARDKAAMDAVAAHARRLGAEVRAGTADECAVRDVLGFVAFADPDGFTVEVYHGATMMPNRFVSPRGTRFVAGSAGFGHIVLRTADPAVTAAFYCDVLGLAVSDFIIRPPEQKMNDVTFLHVNRRHHSLALAGGLDAERRRLGQRCSHVMVEYETIDDVGMAFDAVQARGLPSNLLGRHSNDRMLSFYAQTPSGFNLEFGAGAITVDPATWVVGRYDRASIWGHGEIKVRAIVPETDD